MFNRIWLNEEKQKVFYNAISAMAEFKSVFGRDLAPQSLVELYTAEKLGLKINPRAMERGFDAVDHFGKRYQIKYRHPRTLNVDVNNFDFDYLVLVELDSAYQLSGIWRITSDQARKIFTYRDKFRKYQATQTKVKEIAEQII
mgnify:CR=1 FL=1